MFDISGFRALLSASPTEEIYLDVFLNHDMADVLQWEENPVMIDGLSREVCHELVHARAVTIIGDGVNAEHAAVMLSTVVPLARDLDEVDEAIGNAGRWLAMMASIDETGLPLFLRIAAVMEACEESGLLDADPDLIPEEDRDDFEETLRLYDIAATQGRFSFSLGGHELEIVVTKDEIVVGADIGGGDWEGLYGFPHSDQDDWGGGGGDDEPEPEDSPDPRLLQDA